jgi:hypothetical protein
VFGLARSISFKFGMTAVNILSTYVCKCAVEKDI